MGEAIRTPGGTLGIWTCNTLASYGGGHSHSGRNWALCDTLARWELIRNGALGIWTWKSCFPLNQCVHRGDGYWLAINRGSISGAGVLWLIANQSNYPLCVCVYLLDDWWSERRCSGYGWDLNLLTHARPSWLICHPISIIATQWRRGFNKLLPLSPAVEYENNECVSLFGNFQVSKFKNVYKDWLLRWILKKLKNGIYEMCLEQ